MTPSWPPTVEKIAIEQQIPAADSISPRRGHRPAKSTSAGNVSGVALHATIRRRAATMRSSLRRPAARPAEAMAEGVRTVWAERWMSRDAGRRKIRVSTTHSRMTIRICRSRRSGRKQDADPLLFHGRELRTRISTRGRKIAHPLRRAFHGEGRGGSGARAVLHRAGRAQSPSARSCSRPTSG